MSKRIIIITHRFYPIIGGAENQALLLAKCLALRGNDVQILTSKIGNLPRREMKDNVSIVRFNKYGIDKNFHFFILLFNFRILLYLLFRLHQFDKVLYFFSLDFFAISAFPLKWLGKETIIRTATPSAMEIGGNFKDTKFYKFRRYLLSAFNKFIAITNAIETNLLSEGIKPKQILRMSNSVDLSLFYPLCSEERMRLRRQLNLAGEKIYLLFCGHFYKTKGLDFLIDSVIDLGKNRQFNNVELLILGGSQSISKNDSFEENIINMVHNKYNLPVGINFLGQVYEREKYFRVADIFILPSQSEGMPNALLEAMACGLACIATNVGGVPEVIQNEKNGLIIGYGDNMGLGDAICKLIDNEYLRKNVGEQGSILIKSHYEAEIVSKEYEIILKGIL